MEGNINVVGSSNRLFKMQKSVWQSLEAQLEKFMKRCEIWAWKQISRWRAPPTDLEIT